MTRLPFGPLRRWWRTRRHAGPPRIERFQCDTDVVLAGGDVVLSWKVSGAGVVLLEPGLGELPAEGRLRVPVHADAPAVWTLVGASRQGRVTQQLQHPPVFDAGARLRTAAAATREQPRLSTSQPQPLPAVPMPMRRRPAGGQAHPDVPQLHPTARLRAVPRFRFPDLLNPERPA